MNIPGKIAKQTSQQFADTVTRCFAGDPVLITQIEANAESDHPINSMACESVNEMQKEPDPFIARHKRRLLELKIKEHTVALVQTRQETVMQERELTLPLTLQGIKSVTDLSPLGVLDERSRLMFKDLVTNFATGFVQQFPLLSLWKPQLL